MKRFFRAVVVIGLITQVTLGCKQDRRAYDTTLSQASSVDENPDTAVLYFGGFNSCSQELGLGYPDNMQPIAPLSEEYGMSMSRWASRLGKAIPKPHRALIACYPFWAKMPQDGTSLTSEKAGPGAIPQSAGHVNALEAPIYFRHNLSGTWTPTEKIRLSQLLDSIKIKLESYNIKKVAILGHSHGGYTSMLLAKRLSKNDSAIKVKSMTTLDPISMDTCQPQNIIDILQKSAISPGCNESPASSLLDSNITSAEINQLAANIPWTNLWQAADIYLHSSPIFAAGIENIEVIYDRGKNHGIVNHVAVLYPEDTTMPKWSQITDSVIAKIGRYLN